MKKAVIFDMDGVIVDSEPAYIKQIQAMMKTKGYDLSYQYLLSFIGIEDVKAFETISKDYQLKESGQQLSDAYQVYRKQHPFSFEPLVMDDVEVVLFTLQKHGIKCALASSSPLLIIQNVLQETGLEAFFEVVLSGQMCQHSKPDPEIFITAASRLNCRVSECLVIEDSQTGILAAHRAQMDVLALKNKLYTFDTSLATEEIDALVDVLDYLNISLEFHDV